jgi:hypothetical protein
MMEYAIIGALGAIAGVVVMLLWIMVKTLFRRK